MNFSVPSSSVDVVSHAPILDPNRFRTQKIEIQAPASIDTKDGNLRAAFQDFVGETFFAQLIKSMRSGQNGAAYFNGGRAEEIFQGQFDQMMSEHLSDAAAPSIADPMFEVFQLGRVR